MKKDLKRKQESALHDKRFFGRSVLQDQQFSAYPHPTGNHEEEGDRRDDYPNRFRDWIEIAVHFRCGVPLRGAKAFKATLIRKGRKKSTVIMIRARRRPGGESYVNTGEEVAREIQTRRATIPRFHRLLWVNRDN